MLACLAVSPIETTVSLLCHSKF